MLNVKEKDATSPGGIVEWDPGSDIRNVSKSLIEQTIISLRDHAPEVWYAQFCELTQTPLSAQADACASAVTALFNLLSNPDLGFREALVQAGFYDTPVPAQQAFMAKLGQLTFCFMVNRARTHSTLGEPSVYAARIETVVKEFTQSAKAMLLEVEGVDAAVAGLMILRKYNPPKSCFGYITGAPCILIKGRASSVDVARLNALGWASHGAGDEMWQFPVPATTEG